jgi:hypothetical protein
MAKPTKLRLSRRIKGASGSDAGVAFGVSVFLFTNTGVPAAGTVGTGTGAGWAGKGSVCVNVSTGIAYSNTGTLASPVWTKISGT